VYDRGVEQTSVRSWRPQAFGRRNHRDIVDPVIEPLWNGDRVIVRVVRDGADVSDVDGKPITTDLDDILPQLVAAVRAEELVIDGYLTRQATPPPGTVYLVGSELPTAGQMTSQMLVGRGLRARAMERVETKEKSLDSSNPLAFVAIDLLSVDDESLLDIPLLERKRLLESVLGEDELVRRGVYVRPPVDAWLASWRSLGFRELAYKAANGRYAPGETNDTWALVRIPTN
jgi:ATP-dependent DNA ligase